ncbi:hypothetical protein SOVF_043030 isoform A [Spinacia oleracea]|nr:hypothetical protein SOVF_043030 isoform A [Spinacia oleracea]
MGSLPVLVALRKDHGWPTKRDFLACVTEGSRQGCIALSSEADALSPSANFFVHPPKDGLVHLRSRYNNKYLCRAEGNVVNLFLYFIAAGENWSQEEERNWGGFFTKHHGARRDEERKQIGYEYEFGKPGELAPCFRIVVYKALYPIFGGDFLQMLWLPLTRADGNRGQEEERCGKTQKVYKKQK